MIYFQLNFLPHLILYTKRGDSLYILLSLSICQRTADIKICPKWKPEGLKLSAGPFPDFLCSIYYLQRPESCSTLNRHLSCEPRSTVSRLFFLALIALQKGGVPAAPSGTATLLRLSPNHQFCLRPILAVTDFRHPRLSWLDGRCVQGPGTYSPRHG